MKCFLPDSYQPTQPTKQVKSSCLVSVHVCVWECLHKRGSAGFPGSGHIQYVNTASGSTSGIKERQQRQEYAERQYAR